jgi:hypothetical protein
MRLVGEGYELGVWCMLGRYEVRGNGEAPYC